MYRRREGILQNTMNPECLLLTTPSVNFNAFSGVCMQVLGYSPSRASDATSREMSDSEKWLSWLAAFQDRKAHAGLATNLLTHVMFSMLVVADDRDLLDILQRCAGMPFVTAETVQRGIIATVVTGTLAQWRDAVAAGSCKQVETSVRAGFNKMYSIFRGAGLDVWGDYRVREAPDQTLLLEYKPR
jgi:hypothetical protein